MTKFAEMNAAEIAAEMTWTEALTARNAGNSNRDAFDAALTVIARTTGIDSTDWLDAGDYSDMPTPESIIAEYEALDE